MCCILIDTQVDLKCVTAAKGGKYYPEHLQVLGTTYLLRCFVFEISRDYCRIFQGLLMFLWTDLNLPTLTTCVWSWMQRYLRCCSRTTEDGTLPWLGYNILCTVPPHKPVYICSPVPLSAVCIYTVCLWPAWWQFLLLGDQSEKESLGTRLYVRISWSKGCM